MRPERIRKAAAGLSPVTLFKFHEALKKRKYRVLFSAQRRGKPGPKGPSRALIETIVEMKRRNRRFGCRRIAQQLAKAFGVEIDKDVVRRVLAKYYRPGAGGGGPSWLTFIGHAKDSLWSVDLFRCESITLSAHWVLVVRDQLTRRIIGSGVHAGAVDGVALCRMFNNAISNRGIPKYLSSDNDPLLEYHRWQANLRVLDVDEIETVPFVPISSTFVERLIGTIRRECLDQMFFWSEVDLERKLDAFRRYFNDHRIHSSLDGHTPAAASEEAIETCADLGNFKWRSHCRGLYEPPLRRRYGFATDRQTNCLLPATSRHVTGRTTSRAARARLWHQPMA